MKRAAFSIILGLSVAISVAVPWSIMAGLNLRWSPRIPWCVLLVAFYLTFLLMYLNGRWWPKNTALARRRLLRWRWLSGREWLVSLLAGAPGILALWLVFAACGGLSGPSPPSHNAELSAPMLVIAVLVGAAVTAIGEEAGFRGYMQAGLETHLSLAATLCIVGVVFSIMHLSHGVGTVLHYGAFYFAVSCIYGLLAHFTESILPSLFLHFAGDAALFSLRTALVHVEVPHTPVAILLFVVCAVVLSAASGMAFKWFASVKTQSRAADA